MIRGTDTQFVFNLPCECSNLTSVKIIFWQPENNGPSALYPLPIIKTLDHCSSSGKQLRVILEKNETLRFSDKRKAYSQIIYSTTNGLTSASKPKMITVYPVYDGAIDDSDFGVLDSGTTSSLHDDAVVYIDGGALGDRYYDVSVTQDKSMTATYYAELQHLEIVGSGEMQSWSADEFAPWNAYANKIKSVLMSQNIVNIGAYAFAGCTSITKVSIPNSVIKIGARAFSGCTSVLYYDFTDFTFVPELEDTNAFDEINDTCEIRVPANLYEEWIAADVWSKRSGMIIPIGEEVS